MLPVIVPRKPTAPDGAGRLRQSTLLLYEDEGRKKREAAVSGFIHFRRRSDPGRRHGMTPKAGVDDPLSPHSSPFSGALANS